MVFHCVMYINNFWFVFHLPKYLGRILFRLYLLIPHDSSEGFSTLKSEGFVCLFVSLQSHCVAAHGTRCLLWWQCVFLSFLLCVETDHELLQLMVAEHFSCLPNSLVALLSLPTMALMESLRVSMYSSGGTGLQSGWGFSLRQYLIYLLYSFNVSIVIPDWVGRTSPEVSSWSFTK